MRQSFLYGTIILIVAGGITKILGFANRIVLSRIIGAEGMGLYQMVVPLLYFVITLTTFGLPVAIAKQVAETEASNEPQKTRRFLLLSLFITSGLSVLISGALAIGAKAFTQLLFADKRITIVLLASIPVIPIASISAVLRGYFQGKHNMSPTAHSQLIEQIVRMALVVVMTTAFIDMGIQYATAGAVASIIFGEAAGLFYILWQFRKASKRAAEQVIRTPIFASLIHTQDQLGQLIRFAFPVTMSRLVGSIAYLLEPMLVPFSLVLAGYHTMEATKLYGQFAGMAVPLLMFPTFLTYSLSISLVPAVAEGAVQKNGLLIHRRIYQAMRISLVIGAPCTVILYIFAEPLSILLYRQSGVGHLLKEMAPFSIFLFFQAPLAAALQGLDQAHVVFRNTLIGAVVKIAGMFLFTSRPYFGIDGAVISLNLGITLVTLLHFASLVKGIGFSINLAEFSKIGASMLLMGYAAWYMADTIYEGHITAQTLLICSASSTLLYVLLLIGLKVLDQQDVKRIPWIGRQLAAFFPKK